MFRPIRVRLTLWYVLLLAVILAVFSAGVYFALRENLYNNLDDSLYSRAQIIDSVLQDNNGQLQLSAEDAPGDPQGELFTRVFDSAGRLVFDNVSRSAAIPVDSAAAGAAIQGRATQSSTNTAGDHLRVLTTPIIRNDAIMGAIQVGLSEADVRDTLRTLLLIIAIAYPLTLAVASAGGVFLAGRALGPIDNMTRVAKRLSAEDLSQRLDMQMPDDEVGRLAHTFNEMIARLEEAFHRQRQFTADASHELRTPLTAIKGQTEVVLQRDRDPEDYRQVLQVVNSEVDRMIRLVGSLLALARADSGQMPLAKEPVDLGRIVADAVEQLRPAAEAKNIDLESRSGPVIRFVGDEDLLLQLMLNLLDNAVKYTPEHQLVGATWSIENGCAVIRVMDTGPGIAEEDLLRIFDRFYRVDQSRNQANGGSGLGLPISRWIAEAHGGTLTAESTRGRGATFTVRLPLTNSHISS